MPVFYSGGHIGDTIYQLYTIMKAGGGTLKIGPGQRQMWGSREIQALLPLCRYQPYIVHCSEVEDDSGVDYNFFRDVGRLCNPDDFFEWDERVWPGNCNLRKRYFNWYYKEKGYTLVKQMNDFQYDEKWLIADYYLNYDVVFHAPLRKLNGCRSQDDWLYIFRQLQDYKIMVIGGPDDLNEWPSYGPYNMMQPGNLKTAAELINSCKLFMGASSCNNAIAEGLDKFRFLDVAPQAESSYPLNERGWDITKWSNDRVVRSARTILMGQ